MSTWRGIILPIGLGGLLLAIATTWLGWWDSALFGQSGRATVAQIAAGRALALVMFVAALVSVWFVVAAT